MSRLNILSNIIIFLDKNALLPIYLYIVVILFIYVKNDFLLIESLIYFIALIIIMIFINSSLKNVNFKGSFLRNVEFKNCKLYEVNFKDVDINKILPYLLSTKLSLIFSKKYIKFENILSQNIDTYTINSLKRLIQKQHLEVGKDIVGDEWLMEELKKPIKEIEDEN